MPIIDIYSYKSSGYIAGIHRMGDQIPVIFVAPIKVEIEINQGNVHANIPGLTHK